MIFILKKSCKHFNKNKHNNADSLLFFMARPVKTHTKKINSENDVKLSLDQGQDY